MRGTLIRSTVVAPASFRGSLVPQPLSKRRPLREARAPAFEPSAERGASLREAVALAQQLGARVEILRRTGELVFEHPLHHRRVRVNCRRKDAPRILITMLRAVELRMTHAALDVAAPQC